MFEFTTRWPASRFEWRGGFSQKRPARAPDTHLGAGCQLWQRDPEIIPRIWIIST